MKKRSFESTLQRAEKAERGSRELAMALAATMREKWALDSALTAARRERDDSVFEVEQIMDEVQNLKAANRILRRSERRWQFAWAFTLAILIVIGVRVFG
jgi:hypothetical protein